MADILVIGGGIAGVSAAARLSEDAKVVVLERETALGYHASGRSAAVFEENYGAPSVCALNRASRAFFEEGEYLSPRGLMLLGLEGEEAALEADMQALNCEEISLGEARRHVPILSDQVVRAAYHEAAYDIDTDRLIQDFARILRGNGGRIHLGAEVLRIEAQRAGWRVETQAETFHAGHLVNAAGAWAERVAQMAGLPPLGIVPHRRSMARIPAPQGRDVSRFPIFFGPGETWYAKPDAGKLLISPADEDPVEPQDAWADDMTLAQGIDRYQRYVRPEVTRVESSWAGLRSFAPDRTLVLGSDPLASSFVWCAGQGGYGFTTAPAASALLADLVFDRPCGLAEGTLSALTPGRLRTGK